MTKFIKIMYIGFCFGICNLRSETYNVITVSRDTTAASYNRLSTEEIYLVFAQLARCLQGDDSKIFGVIWTSDQLGEPTKTPLITHIKRIPIKKISVAGAPTIVVFNEAFFGKDSPLPKTEQEKSSEAVSTPPKKKQRVDLLDVDGIIGVYNRFCPYMSDAYLYINFLYKDYNNKNVYSAQIDISKRRYKEIKREEYGKYTSICFSEFDYFINDGEEGPKKKQGLLFNQTKIFYGGEEIGYYNKSSYFDEYTETLHEGLYYVIGDFQTHPLSSGSKLPLIDCLTCYDIDVVSEMYKKYIPQKQICVFSSNTTTSLPYAVDENKDLQSTTFICSDGHFIDSADLDKDKRLSGFYKYEELTSSIGEFQLFHQDNIFTFKLFTLTTTNPLTTLKP